MRFLLTKLSHFFIFFLGLSVTAPSVGQKTCGLENGTTAVSTKSLTGDVIGSFAG